MPEDGLSTDRNIYHTCKGTILIKINLRCVRMNNGSLFRNKHNYMVSMKIPILAQFPIDFDIKISLNVTYVKF